MSDKIVVPILGESVTEATVSKWLKAQGEKVTVDEPIVELETDKVNVEVPAPSNGVLESISVNEGETVNVGALLGVINDSINKNKEKIKEVKNYSPPMQKNLISKKTSSTPHIFENKPEKIEVEAEQPLILNEVHEEKTKTNQSFTISPSARKMALEAKIDTNKIKGSGKIIDELEKNEIIDKNLLRYMTVKVKKFDLEAKYFSRKDEYEKKEYKKDYNRN